VTDLEELHLFLAERGIAHALIGATAFGIHGHVRSTLGVDLLVTDRLCLSDDFWGALRERGWRLDVRRGDAFGSLAGSVRGQGPGRAAPIDLMVGRMVWDARAIERAEPKDVGGFELPVATACDLVLLKLAAGGGKDMWDVSAFLDTVDDEEALRAGVEEELATLDVQARRLWSRLLAERTSL
jgi:hypothetical protein